MRGARRALGWETCHEGKGWKVLKWKAGMQPGTLSPHLGVSQVRPAHSSWPLYPAAGCPHLQRPCSDALGPLSFGSACSRCLPPTRSPAAFCTGSGGMAASQVC